MLGRSPVPARGRHVRRPTPPGLLPRRRFPLSRADGYALDPDAWACRLRAGYDLAVVVNPNNPTGRHVPRRAWEAALRQVPLRTRVWIDEAYLEYVGAGQSLESCAAASK